MAAHSILWRRFDLPGYDFCSMRLGRNGLVLTGAALFAFRGKPCRLAYSVETDPDGRTRRVRVDGIAGSKPVAISITADRAGRWRSGGRTAPQVEGCEDVDLSFSPSTNTLPLRRLSKASGGAFNVRAAWLRFPDFTLHPLNQTYRRIAAETYRYETHPGQFSTTLSVDPLGWVTRYGRQWKAVARHRSL